MIRCDCSKPLYQRKPCGPLKPDKNLLNAGEKMQNWSERDQDFLSYYLQHFYFKVGLSLTSYFQSNFWSPNAFRTLGREMDIIGHCSISKVRTRKGQELA